MARRYSDESQLKMINGARKSAEVGKQKKRAREDKYYLDPSLCKKCRKALPYEKRKNKFCDSSCAASFNNKGVARNLTTGKNRVKKCLFCEKGTSNEKYCGHKCAADFSRMETYKKIEECGKIPHPVTGKNYLIETRGNKCEICGLTEWQGKEIVMILDHIDGNSSDDSVSNLRLICPNCDSQTPTYKGRNKGNGRHSRRIRYSEGKSY